MRRLRVLHRWLGLILALPLLCQGLTGFIMATEAGFAAGTAAASSDAPMQDVSAIIATAAAAGPAGLAPIRFRIGAEAVAGVDLAAHGQAPAARILIDPRSLAILGSRSEPDRLFRLAHALHETLLVEGPLGRSIVGWSGIGLLIMAVSGLALRWPRRFRFWAALAVPGGARGYRLWRELHGAAGFWLFALLLLQGISGVSLAFPEAARAALGLPPVTRTTVPPIASSEFDIDSVVAAAKAAAPNTALRDIRLPANPDRPISVALLPDGSTEGSPMVQIRLDPTGRIVSIDDPRRTPASALLSWLRALHEGHGFGPGWTALIAALGLLLPIQAASGAALWLRGSKRRAAAEIPERAGR